MKNCFHVSRSMIDLVLLLLLPVFGVGNDTENIRPLNERNGSDVCELEILQNFSASYPVALWERNGFFVVDYLRKINIHWLKFSPPFKESHYALAVLYVFIMVLGLFGNILVVYMFIRCKSLRTSANILVVNLAISDMLMMSKMPIFIYNSVHMGPALGEIACRYYGFVGGLSGTCSICTLSAISLDRYYVIKFPLNRRFTNVRAKISVALSWIYAITFSSIPLLDIGLGVYTPEGYLTSCSYDYLSNERNAKIFILVFFAAAWVVPFGLITFSYVNILQVVLVARNIKKTTRDSSRHMKVEEKKKQDIKISLIVFLVILMWFAAWTPYATVSLLGVFGFKNLINPLTSMIPALFCKTASCLDPFVYALTHPRYKEEIRKLFCKPKREQRSSKLWTTQSREDTGISNIDEESAVLHMKREESVRVPFKKRFSSTSVVQPSEELVLKKSDLNRKASGYKPSRWFKPSFSNNSSTIRKLARTWSSRDKSVEEEEIEVNSMLQTKL